MTAGIADLALNRCAYCGLSIYRNRGGWRHTVTSMRICKPTMTARIATPRTAESKTPAAGAPRSLLAGCGPAGSPQRGARDGAGRLLLQGHGSRPGPASRVTDETWAWQTAKESFPELVPLVLRWLELGDRVYEAMRGVS